MKSGTGDDRIAPDMLSLERIIGYKLRRAQLAVFQDFLDSFSQMELRPAEFSVIAIVARNPGLKQAAIAQMLAIKPANLVALIDGLQKRSLIERRKGDTDRRTYALFLTDAGERFVARMFGTWRQHEDRLIERLGGTAERDRLLDLLDRLLGQAGPDGD